MFAEVKDKTVSKMPWFDINCKWVGTNKLFGKQDNPYDGGKKGFCDDGHFAQDENGIWRQVLVDIFLLNSRKRILEIV